MKRSDRNRLPREVVTHRRTTFEINGVKYERLEDVPAEFRHLFADRDGDGVPDVVESARDAVRTSSTRVTTWSGRPDEIPPELRSLIGEAQVDGSPRLGELASIRCARCGCHLGGTAVGANCPECGHAVMSTIRAVASRPSHSSSARKLVDIVWHSRGVLPLLLLAVVVLLALIAFKIIL